MTELSAPHDPEQCDNPKCPACLRIVSLQFAGDDLAEWIEAFADRPPSTYGPLVSAWQRAREWPARSDSSQPTAHSSGGAHA